MLKAISSINLEGLFRNPESKGQLKSTTSLAAEAAVKEAIEQVLKSQQGSKSSIPRDHTGSDMSVLAGDYVRNTIDTILEEISSHSKPSKKHTSSCTSIQAASIVDSALQSVMGEMAAESLTMSEMGAIVAKVDNSVENMLAEKHSNDHFDSHHAFHPEDDDSSEDEFPIHPVLDNKELMVDHHDVEQALSIFSVRKDDDLEHLNIDLAPTAAVPRNSFRNLLRPDVSKVSRLASQSTTATCERIKSMSSRCLFQKASHMAPPSESQYSSTLSCPFSAPVQEVTTEEDGEENEIGYMPIHTDKEFDDIIHYYSDDEDAEKTSKSKPSGTQKGKSLGSKNGSKTKITASPYKAKIDKCKASNTSTSSRRSSSQKIMQAKSSSTNSSKTNLDVKTRSKDSSTCSVKQKNSQDETVHKTSSTRIVEATEIVQNVMDTVLQQMKAENLSQKEMKLVEDKVKKSVESLIISGKSSLSDATHHIVHDEDEESSEDEFPIHPVMDKSELKVDHHDVENALAIFSVRRDDDLSHLDVDLDPCAPIPRYSFRDVFHPDVSKVRRLSSTCQEDSIRKIQSLSSKCMLRRKSHVAQPDDILPGLADLELQLKLEEEATDVDEKELDFVPIHTDKEFDEVIHYFSDEDDEETKQTNDTKPQNMSERITRKDSKASNRSSRSSLKKQSSGGKKVTPQTSNSSTASKGNLQKPNYGSGRIQNKDYDSSYHGSNRSSTTSFPENKFSKKGSEEKSKSVGHKSAVEITVTSSKASQSRETKKQSRSSLLKEVAKKLEGSSQNASVPRKQFKDCPTPKGSAATLTDKSSSRSVCRLSKSPEGKQSSRNLSGWASRTSASHSPQTSRNPFHNPSRNQSRNQSNAPSQASSKNPSRAPSQPTSKAPSRAPSRQGTQSPSKRSSHNMGRNSRSGVHASPGPSRNPSNKSASSKKDEGSGRANREDIDVEDSEEIPEEIEAPLRRPRRRGSRNSSTSLNKPPSNNGRKHSYNRRNSKDNLSQKGSQQSRPSRQTVNIAPRPSSGYRKSPTPASVASAQAVGPRASGESNISPTHSAQLQAQVHSDQGLATRISSTASSPKGPSPKGSNASLGKTPSKNQSSSKQQSSSKATFSVRLIKQLLGHKDNTSLGEVFPVLIFHACIFQFHVLTSL